MKKIVSACALLAAATVLASGETSVESANTFGILKITPTSAETVIGVPWITTGEEPTSADGLTNTVAGLVLASGLPKDTYLLWYDTSATGKYKAWTIASEGTTSWTAVTDAKYGSPGSATETGIPQGNALIVKQPSDSDLKPIYLSGQLFSGTAKATTTIKAGTSDAVTYTLLAPPSAIAYDLNTATWTGTPSVDDSIILALEGGSYFYDSTQSKWGKYVTETKGSDTIKKKSYEGVTIPAGQGAWYVRKGTGDLSVQW